MARLDSFSTTGQMQRTFIFEEDTAFSHNYWYVSINEATSFSVK